MKEKKMESKRFYECLYGSHAITLEKFELDEDEINIFFWYLGTHENMTFWSKIKAVYQFFKHGRYLFEDIILSKNDAKQLGEQLIKISRED